MNFLAAVWMNVAIAASDLHHHQPKCNGRLCMKQQQQVLGAPWWCCGIEEREWLLNFNLIFSEWFYVFLYLTFSQSFCNSEISKLGLVCLLLKTLLILGFLTVVVELGNWNSDVVCRLGSQYRVALFHICHRACNVQKDVKNEWGDRVIIP